MGLNSFKWPRKEQSKEMLQSTTIDRRHFLRGALGLGLMAAGADSAALAATLTRAAEDSRQKEEPKVTFEVSLSRHAHGKDMEAAHLAEKMKNADVYLFEMVGCDDELVADLNAVSTHTMTPGQFFAKNAAASDDLLRAQVDAIYAAPGVLVSTVDLKNDSRLFKKADALINAPAKTPFNLGVAFKETLTQFLATAQAMAELQNMREIEMEARVESLLKAIRSKDMPQLKDQSEVRVLMQIGSAHTGVYHELKRLEKSTIQSFPSMPYVFAYKDELLRSLLFGKNASEELVAHAWLGHWVEQTGLVVISDDQQKDNHFERSVLSKFTMVDIHQLHDQMKRSDNPIEAFRTSFLAMVEQKQLHWPRTLEEYEQMKI